MDNESGLCVQNILIIFRCILLSQWLREHMGSLKREKNNLHVDPSVQLLHLNFDDYETWSRNLHDSQMLSGWNNFQTNPPVNIVIGVASAHNRATQIYIKLCVESTWSKNKANMHGSFQAFLSNDPPHLLMNNRCRSNKDAWDKSNPRFLLVSHVGN